MKQSKCKGELVGKNVIEKLGFKHRRESLEEMKWDRQEQSQAVGGCGSLNKNGPVDSWLTAWWNCLKRIRRCSLVKGGVSLGWALRLQKPTLTQALSHSASCLWIST